MFVAVCVEHLMVYDAHRHGHRHIHSALTSIGTRPTEHLSEKRNNKRTHGTGKESVLRRQSTSAAW